MQVITLYWKKKIVNAYYLCVFLHFAVVSMSQIQFLHCRNEKYSNISNTDFFTFFLAIVKSWLSL